MTKTETTKTAHLVKHKVTSDNTREKAIKDFHDKLFKQNGTQKPRDKAQHAQIIIWVPPAKKQIGLYSPAERRSTPLSSQQLAQVEKSFATGNAVATWDLLASYGDSYAVAAVSGIKDSTSYYGLVIRNAWHAADADFSKFNAVALQHQRSYIDILKENIKDKGVSSLPTTTQIEQSYYRALDRYGVSPLTAVDLLFSKISSEISKITPGNAPNWYNHLGGLGVDIEQDRIGPPSDEAMRLTLADASGRLTRIVAFTADSLGQWHSARARVHAQ